MSSAVRSPTETHCSSGRGELVGPLGFWCDACSDLYCSEMGEDRVGRAGAILVACTGVGLIVAAVIAMLRRQDVLAGSLAMLGLGAVILAGLMPRLTGPIEVGPSGLKLQVMQQLAQAGKAAGYRQDEILAALEEMGGSPEMRMPDAPASDAHVPIPPASGYGAPGLEQANMAAAHRERYLRTGEPEELAAALHSIERAIQMAATGSDSLPNMLGLFGELMLESFRRTGETADLDQAVEILQRALADTTTGSPAYGQILSQLARAVQARYERLGGWKDQEQVLGLLQHLEEVRRRAA